MRLRLTNRHGRWYELPWGPMGPGSADRPTGRDRTEGEMSEPKRNLASLGLDHAIRLRWVLRDIIGKRLKFSPIAPNDLLTLIDLGYIEMKDEVPTVYNSGTGRDCDWQIVV
jgi:hypothetical protein